MPDDNSQNTSSLQWLTHHTSGGSDIRHGCTRFLWSTTKKNCLWRQSVTSGVIYIHTQPHKLIHCTNQTTHINTLSHTLKPPKAAMWWLYRVSCFSPLPHNPSVSHNRKLKERVAVPRAPRLFDLCEPLSLMKISAVLWTTGAADRGATCSPHNSQRLPTSERCNRPAGEDAGWVGGRELERPGDAVSARFPSDGCRLHTNRQV